MPIFASMPNNTVIYVLSEHNQFRKNTHVYQYIRSMHSVLKWHQFNKPGAVCVIKFNQKTKWDNLLLLSTEYIYI